MRLQAGRRSVASMNEQPAAQPRVLIVYFTYTQQSRKVAEAMADVFLERSCDVRQAAIELTDARYAARFTRFPLRHAYLDIIGMVPAQLRGATGEIRIPPEAEGGDYDLVCIGSPTWWLKTSVPIRSFLKSDEAGRLLDGKRFAVFVVCRRYWSINLNAVERLGAKRGGRYVKGVHFSFAGGQVRSLLALLSYFGKGENNERYLGMRIPPTNLKPDYREQARAFAAELADGLASGPLGVSALAKNAMSPAPTSTMRNSVT
jgi:menaquinone-dependent protoporphyrinogen IX oxidase